jgi:hypothetical protein
MGSAIDDADALDVRLSFDDQGQVVQDHLVSILDNHGYQDALKHPRISVLLLLVWHSLHCKALTDLVVG